MGSGKRASMREGPLAALFRKTETDGLGDPAALAAQNAGGRRPGARAVRGGRARRSRSRSRARAGPRADAAGAAAPRVLR
jgi:hypothetical protein